MGRLVARAWEFVRSPQGLRWVRYATVSAISSVTSFVVLAIVFGVLRLWTAVPSTLFANVVAGVPSYFLNRQWVWKKSGRSHVRKEVIPFWVLSIAGILFSLVTASLATRFADDHHLTHLVRTAVVLGANVAAFGILWLAKFFVFNRLFFTEPSPAAPAALEDALGGGPVA
ncbi:MAG: GtrA family protein [Actinomycetota bacterium]|nr:GtrA family protein [Actinomycetota bacterium]